jgi:NifB/MoaA-like Fe-S oxidoreductase
LKRTCTDLENWGVKTLTLRKFGNSIDQGLIFNNQENIIKDIETQTYEEFKGLVDDVINQYSFNVFSFPFYDPKIDFPFAISKKKNEKFLEALPEVEKETTIITGKLAEPFIKKIFELIDENKMVNVVGVKKDIADLIVPEDLKSIELARVHENVVLPRGALVHDLQVQKIFRKDGIKRTIKRGPYHLTHPYYENLYFTYEELLNYELNSFKELIDEINR